MINKKEAIKRVFAIEYKIEYYFNLSEIDTLVLGLANIQDSYGKTALIHATHENYKEVILLLTQSGININTPNRYGRTALMYAADKGHEEVVEILIKAKADVNIQDINGRTALIFASAHGYDKIVEILLKAKPNINIEDDDYQTALICAKTDKIKNMLIQAGAK